MSNTSTYLMPFKRRLKQKTNFRKRYSLLLSGIPRAVLRKTNNNTIVQIVEYQKTGDKTIVHGNSKELKELGWTLHTANTSAAYLTGFLTGLKAKNKGVKKAVFDIGLVTPVHKSRIFAGLKGLVDAGIEIPHDAAVFPSQERISGTHLKENAAGLFEKVRALIQKKYGEVNG